MRHKPITVLIAEDDFLISEEIKRVVTQSDRYEIAGEAFDGNEALAMTIALKPDVVLMDIEMPEMSGLEAARKIQRYCPTPIVVLSAHESRQLVAEACLQSGIGAYLTKPPKFAEIDRAITLAMARHWDMLALRTANEELTRKMNEIHPLHGVLPICSFCKSIRNEQGEWERIESYIHQRSAATFSHSFCPQCAEKHYPDDYKAIFPENEP